MKPELERQIADALECTPELFPNLMAAIGTEHSVIGDGSIAVLTNS